MVLTRRLAAFLFAAGAFQWLVWPNFLRVVWLDKRAFDHGPTAFLLIHVPIVVPALLLGTALLVLGVRGWRLAPPTDRRATARSEQPVPVGRR